MKQPPIYLQEVPFFGQSSMDSACGYYCALMLRVALEGENTWAAWWTGEKSEEDLGIPSMSRILKKDSLSVDDLASRLKDVTERYQVGTEDDSGKLITPERLKEKVLAALGEGKPSILRLPDSAHHPFGHYVVVKGYLRYIDKSKKTRELFVVNDPLVGETVISAALEHLADTLFPEDKADKCKATALIATSPSYLRIQKQKSNPPEPTVPDWDEDKYKEIFRRVENTLRQESECSDVEFDAAFGKFRNVENQRFDDDKVFDILIMIAFYSGFKAETATAKQPIIKRHFPDFRTVSKYEEDNIQSILNDTKMIRHEQKIRGCVKNAQRFQAIVEQYDSFQNYLDSFELANSSENLTHLQADLQKRFSYLGQTTSLHFMMELGLPVLKPDRVILRIFHRLGIIQSEHDLMDAVIQGRNLSAAVGEPIRYVDIIFVKYGQVGAEQGFGLKRGICLQKKPLCDKCSVTQYCQWYQENQSI